MNISDLYEGGLDIFLSYKNITLPISNHLYTHMNILQKLKLSPIFTISYINRSHISYVYLQNMIFHPNLQYITVLI